MGALLLAIAVAGAPSEERPTFAPLLWMPVSGPSGAQADAAVRAATPELVGEAATRAAIEDARALGIACELDDVTCLAKVGTLADAAHVGTLVIRDEPGGFVLSALVVHVGTASVVSAPLWRAPRDAPLAQLAPLLVGVALDPASGGALLAQTDALVVIDGVTRGTGPIAVAVAPGSHVVQLGATALEVSVERRALVIVSPPPRPAAPAVPVAVAVAPEPPPPAPVEAASRPMWPFIVGASGLALGAGAGFGVGAMELMLASSMGRYEERATWQVAGRALAGVAAVGLIAGGAGFAAALVME